MTDHVARLYALALGTLVFFVVWALVAAHPWATTTAASAKPEPNRRVVALQKREARLAREQVQVNRLLKRRWAVYRRKLAERQRQQAAIDAAAAAAAASAAAAAPAAPAVSAPAVSAPAPSAPVQVTSAPPVTESSSS